jgi:hypothetical protein
VAGGVRRIVPALIRMSQHALQPDTWGFLWIAVVIAAIILLMRDQIRTAALPIYVVVMMTAVYTGVYVVSVAWVMKDLINASIDRLLMHLIIPAVYLIERSVSVSET